MITRCVIRTGLVALATLMALSFGSGPLEPETVSAQDTVTSLDSLPIPEWIDGMLLVKFAPETTEFEQIATLAICSGTLGEKIEGINIWRAGVPFGQVDWAVMCMTTNPNVVYAEPDYVCEGGYLSNDTAIIEGWQYAPSLISADDAWDVTTGSSAVEVAVLDSGVDVLHPDLSGKLIAGSDIVNSDSAPSDDHGHGTHIAGVIAAIPNNGLGAVGIGHDTKVRAIKVLDNTNTGSWGDVAQGIVEATDAGAKIINLSLGGYTGSQTLLDAVEYAWSNGVLLVAAVGNGAQTNPYYPAAYDHVMGVAATNSSDGRWSLSNYGSFVDISAPGDMIYSTHWTDGGPAPAFSGDATDSTLTSTYTYLSGTSQAAPHVSGVAALLLAQDPTRTNQQLWDILTSTSDDLGVAGWDQLYGHGRLNALQAVSGDSSTPEPTLVPTATSAPSSMHVGNLVGWAGGSRNWPASVRVYVEDVTHAPVLGASVNGSWSTGGSSNCVTDASGTCVLSQTVSKKSGSTTVLSITSMTHASISYDSGSNHDPEGDFSTGGSATISVAKSQSAPTPTPSGEEPTPTPEPSETSTTEPTTEPTVEPTATAPPSGYAHVGNLVGWAGGGRNWQASVRAYIENASHSPVSGATVEGTWSTGGSTNCVTDSSGTCVMTRTVSGKNGSTTVFTVSAVSHASLAYYSGSNHDPESDFSAGGSASLTVAKSQALPTPTPSGEEPTPTPVPSETATTQPAVTAEPTVEPTTTVVAPTATPVEPTATVVAPTATPSGTADTLHVSDLDASGAASGPNWTASVTIEVRDELGVIVPSATVEGSFDNDELLRLCVTDDAGRCTISSVALRKKNFSSVIFTVASIGYDSLKYESADNTDPEGDSDGTTITVAKP